MRKVLLVFGILLPLALVVGILIWYFVLYQKSGTEIVPANPTPSVSFGNLSPYAKLCTEFQNTKSKISCEKSIELALAQAPGKVQKVSVGSVPIVDLSSDVKPRKLTKVSMWLIEITLNTPYFEKRLNKQISRLQIGIPLSKNDSGHRKPLE